jgi:predicted DNA-binding transcriptional regulator AlpA
MTLLGIKDLPTMKKYIRDGVLPPRVVLTKRKMGWLKEDIMTWLCNKKEYRNAKQVSRKSRRQSRHPAKADIGSERRAAG